MRKGNDARLTCAHVTTCWFRESPPQSPRVDREERMAGRSFLPRGHKPVIRGIRPVVVASIVLLLPCCVDEQGWRRPDVFSRSTKGLFPQERLDTIFQRQWFTPSGSTARGHCVTESSDTCQLSRMVFSNRSRSPSRI